MSDREYLKSEISNPELSFTPRILSVADDKVWVDNVIDLGDLIERQMGIDTSELYFSVIVELIDRLKFNEED